MVVDDKLNGYKYMFPLLPLPVHDGKLPVLGLHFRGTHAHSIYLHSAQQLDEKHAYKRLSESLALLAIFDLVGLRARPTGGIGGFCGGPAESVDLGAVLTGAPHEMHAGLAAADNSFQVQACFTLSRAFALQGDPESSIIEFFKVIELFIKGLAYEGKFGPDASFDVLRGRLFSGKVIAELNSGALCSPELAKMIYIMKDVRNRFVGHGGIRPTIGEVFGDPESNHDLLEEERFKYDPFLHYGEQFFDRFLNDVSLVARFLFCRMQGVEPILKTGPGCWSSSSEHVSKLLEDEGATFSFVFPSELDGV